MQPDNPEEDNLYLEYSPEQKAFHITSLENIKCLNRGIILKKIKANYLIIAGPGTYEYMVHYRKAFESELENNP